MSSSSLEYSSSSNSSTSSFADNEVQWLIGGLNNYSLSATATGYIPLMGGRGENIPTPQEIQNSQIITETGIISGLNCTLSGSPGTGKSYVFTVLKNGVDTSLTCTIAGTATTGSSNYSLRVQAGDTVTLKVVPTGSPTARRLLSNCYYRPSNDYVFWLGGGGTLGLAANYYYSIGCSTRPASAYSQQVISLFACSGKVTNLYVKLTSALGAGKSATFRYYHNESLVGDTLTISDLATTGNITLSTPITTARGDRLSIRCTSLSASTPANNYIALGATFLNAGDTFPILGNRVSTNFSNSVVNYGHIGHYLIPSTGYTTGQQTMLRSGYLKNFEVKLASAPGVGKSWQFDICLNGDVASAMTVTIADNATTGSYSGKITVNAGDLMTLKCTPSGTPTAANAYFGLAATVNDEVSSSSSLGYTSSSSTSESSSSSSSSLGFTSSSSSSSSSSLGFTSSSSSSSTSETSSSSSTSTSSSSTSTSSSSTSESSSSSSTSESSSSTSTSSSSTSESSSSSSTSESSSSSTSTSSSSSALVIGWTWGFETPIETKGEEWTNWTIMGTMTPATITAPYGQIEIISGQSVVSPVMNTGGVRRKKIYNSINDYGMGSGSGKLYWRGDINSFAQDSDEITGPIWNLVTAPFFTNNQYLQLRLEAN